MDDEDRDFRRAHYRHDTSPLYSSSSIADKNKIRKKIEVDPPRRSIRQRLGNREDERRYKEKERERDRGSERSCCHGYFGYFALRRRRGPRSRSRSSTPDRTSSHSPSTTPTGETEDRNRRKRNHGDAMGGVSNDLKPVAKRQRCKDYDGKYVSYINDRVSLLSLERGMCLLGEQCPFDHGSDPLVITGIPPYPPPPFQLPIPPPHNLPNLPKGNSGEWAVSKRVGG